MSANTCPRDTRAARQRCGTVDGLWTLRAGDVAPGAIEAALGRSGATVRGVLYGGVPSSLSTLRSTASKFGSGYRRTLARVLARLGQSGTPWRREARGRRVVLLLGRGYAPCPDHAPDRQSSRGFRRCYGEGFISYHPMCDSSPLLCQGTK